MNRNLLAMGEEPNPARKYQGYWSWLDLIRVVIETLDTPNEDVAETLAEIDKESEKDEPKE